MELDWDLVLSLVLTLVSLLQLPGGSGDAPGPQRPHHPRPHGVSHEPGAAEALTVPAGGTPQHAEQACPPPHDHASGPGHSWHDLGEPGCLVGCSVEAHPADPVVTNHVRLVLRALARKSINMCVMSLRRTPSVYSPR